MSYINVNGTGKIVTEPELKELSGDKCVIKLRIMATNKAGKDGNNMFIDLEAWDHLARNCNSLMSKGTYIIYSGRLQQDEWVNTKDNKTMTKVKITASDAAAGDEFGKSVAVGGNKVYVGASKEDTGASDSGSVYIYNLDGSGESKIPNPEGDGNARFGISMALGS